MNEVDKENDLMVRRIPQEYPHLRGFIEKQAKRRNNEKKVPEGAGLPKYYPGKLSGCPLLLWKVYEDVSCYTWRDRNNEEFRQICTGIPRCRRECE